MQAPRAPKRPRRGETRATRHWYRQTMSRAGARGLIVERLIPFELAHQIEQVFLLAPHNELLQRAGYRRFLGALAAYFQGTFDEIRVERKIGRHVSLLTH